MRKVNIYKIEKKKYKHKHKHKQSKINILINKF
jgi:hypothetical protein